MTSFFRSFGKGVEQKRKAKEKKFSISSILEVLHMPTERDGMSSIVEEQHMLTAIHESSQTIHKTIAAQTNTPKPANFSLQTHTTSRRKGSSRGLGPRELPLRHAEPTPGTRAVFF